MISWRILFPMSLSISAMLAGFFSIIQGAEGNFLLSAQLIMLSMILDGFDGNVARLLKGTSDFGGEFDTFVDIMSFGVAPALLSYWYVLHDAGIMGLMLCSSVVLSGMLRLSRFRSVDPFRGARGYCGLPITVNAAWVALMIYIAESGGHPAWFTLQSGPVATLCWMVMGALILLQVSTLHYSKPTKSWLFIIPAALLIVMLFLDLNVGVASALGMCLYGLFYAFISPFVPKAVVEMLDDTDDEEELSLPS